MIPKDTPMTTPVNSFEDILYSMGNNPALRDALRRHILTDEFLQVPVRLDRMEQDIALLNEGQTRLEESQTQLQREVSTIHGSLCRLEGTGYEGHVAT